MKIITFFCLILILIDGVRSVVHEKEVGLCAFDYSDFDCVSDRQSNGVCCLINGETKYYDNFCLACK